MTYYELALELARKLGLQQEIADNISNMGVIYKNQVLRLQQAGGNTQAKQKLMDAEKCYLEARDIDRKPRTRKGWKSPAGEKTGQPVLIHKENPGSFLQHSIKGKYHT